MSRSIFQHRILLAAFACCVGAAGCQFWKSDGDSEQLTWRQVFGSDGPKIVDAARAPVETIVLSVAHAEQPLSDISMVDLLYREVDQIGALDAETRRSLEDNGIRVGVTGPNPPRSLQSMLDVSTRARSQQNDGRQLPTGQRVPIVAGQPTTILAGDAYESCEVRIPRGSTPETRVFENVRCMFRVEAEKLQDGWVRLDFLPEIHHGSQALRRVPVDDQWSIRNTQKVEPLYSQKFSLTLSEGEMAVITATHPSPGTLGHTFFIGDGLDDHLQQILVIRVDDILAPRARLDRER